MDEKIIKYASPTLSGLKTGNLFKIYIDKYYPLESILFNYNNLFNPYNIYLYKVYETEKYALIYIFRIDLLKKVLYNKNVKNFLLSCGYDYTSLNSILLSLKNRFYKSKKTPHEVGVFLGYPLEDVLGFIINKGKNYKFSGCWKVYGNSINYEKVFNDYKKCKNKNLILYNMGIPLESLIYV